MTHVLSSTLVISLEIFVGFMSSYLTVVPVASVSFEVLLHQLGTLAPLVTAAMAFLTAGSLTVLQIEIKERLSKMFNVI